MATGKMKSVFQVPDTLQSCCLLPAGQQWSSDGTRQKYQYIIIIVSYVRSSFMPFAAATLCHIAWFSATPFATNESDTLTKSDTVDGAYGLGSTSGSRCARRLQRACQFPGGRLSSSSPLYASETIWQFLLSSFIQPLDTHCCHMGTAIKHPVSDRVKPSFVIFDIWALWRSALSVRVPRCQKLHDDLTRSGTGCCFVAVPIWQQWASKC